MNLFELSAKISIDDSDFKKSMENAQKVSKNVAKAMKELQSPLDKAKSGFNAIAHPVETAKANIEKLKNATEAIRNPIETFKNKVSDASAALETNRNKLSALAAGYDSAKKKVDDLTKEFNKSAKESGTSSKKTQELAKKLKEAESEAANAKKEMDDFAKSVSDAGKNSGSAKDKIAGLVGGLGKVASGLGTAVVTAAKVGAAAVGAAATGIAALTKSAVDGFAEYEQLAGGAAKIFDEMNQADILRDAQNAYKDLGLSANQYLAVINDVGQSLPLGLRPLEPEQRPSVALGQAVFPQSLQHVRRQLQQPQLVGHGGLGLADAPGGLLLAHAEHADKLVDARRLLDEVQIPPLEIFHQGDQAGVLHVHVQQYTGYLLQTCQLCRPEPAFSRHQLIFPAAQTHGERVQYAVGLYALAQLRQRLVVKAAAGLHGIGRKLVRP